ncbi:hypothetical protein FOZ61_002673 [Perkinsus olseni]|uniref:RanBP2-type domain-containing protein n=1 Tax=Perkinsus olseni TaxID=32597 RepID=A0A7J6M820_PEROL|nr:hypothetical protein FOZ61_002673 [Perkinsus olseni]KAF4667722.1 hypothetical protein FOL46_002364 [Perkinsus olseni]
MASDSCNKVTTAAERFSDSPGCQSATAREVRSRPSLAAGGWACVRCGNVNFPQKLFCNMRKCMSPRPLRAWRCKGCGFKESNPLAPRCPECNTARRLSRDDCILVYAHATGEIPFQFQPEAMMAQQLIKAPVGSWVCSACNNVNWPERTRCNGNRCKKARGSEDVLHTQKKRDVLRKYAQELSGPAIPPTLAALQEYAGVHEKGAPVVNSENDSSTVSSGSRSPCCTPAELAEKMITQQRLAELAKVVYIEKEADGRYPDVDDAPPGSWLCVCGNVNWPFRLSCNKLDCGMVRPFLPSHRDA